MGWPFGPKKTAYDPAATRPAQSHPWDKPLDFVQLAMNEGGRQLAETASRVAPSSWRVGPQLEAFADERAQANNSVILDRLKRAGLPLAEIARMDPGDFSVREATFRGGSPYNPQSGGVQGWRAAHQQNVDDWNARAAQEGLALLQEADEPIAPMREPQTADASRKTGLMFGRRR